MGSGFSMYFSVLEEDLQSNKNSGIQSLPLYHKDSSVQAAVFLESWEAFKKVFCSVSAQKLVHFSKFMRRKKVKMCC